MLIAALWVISDVEGMVARSKLLVITALHHKGVGLPPDHIDLRDEQTVDVPGNAPAHVASDGRVAIVAPGWPNLGKEDPVLGLVALNGWDEPGPVTCRGGGRRPRSLVLLFCLFGARLAGYGTVPLRNPSKIKIEVTKEPFLVI
mgnify:CR=1 FL=1